MIPLRDENPSSTVPVVTRLIIALNVVAFVYEATRGSELREFMYQWAFVPARLTLALQGGEESWLGPSVTLLSSMFLHGGWAHLLGNMWYLWIFGDNIEDRLGRLGYIGFYLASGIAAALMHYFVSATSRVPTVGASGAIAGVLGAYAVAYPHARVVTLVPLFPFFQIMALPALLVLGLWFLYQFLSGALSLAWVAGGGIAWWAHIGGFVFGMIAMRVLGGSRRSRALEV